MNTCKFDIFKVESQTDNQPLLFVGRELFQRYDLMNKFKVHTSHSRQVPQVPPNAVADHVP